MARGLTGVSWSLLVAHSAWSLVLGLHMYKFWERYDHQTSERDSSYAIKPPPAPKALPNALREFIASYGQTTSAFARQVRVILLDLTRKIVQDAASSSFT